MIHVMIHLPNEALLAGPLKKCVRNRAKPEGSLVEAWVAYESLTFCAMYLEDVETTFNRPQRNNDGGVRKEKLSVFAQIARPFGDPVNGESFTKNDMEVAHWFILNNCDEALPYLEEHEQLMKREHPSHLYAKKHRDLFPSWFHAHMNKLKELNSPSYDEELYNLARGPLHVELFSGCHVNGIKFLGATRDDKSSTQNSGVHVPSAGDSEDIDFYGKLTSVVQLLYKDRYQVILFKCLWFDTNPHNRTSVKRDHGLLSVNTTTHWYDEDPYILATMAKQTFYLDDPKAGNGWKVVQKIERIGLYDIPELDHDDNDDIADQQLSSSIEIGEETLRDTNIFQEPFDIPGVPEFEISIDLGDLPQYNAPEEANEDEDEWESGNDSSEDSESYYCNLDDVFVPLPDDLFVDLSESRSVVESMFQDNSNLGGKLLIFQNTLPSHGVGSLRLRGDDLRVYGSDKEHPVRLPEDPFYKQMATEFTKFQIGVDVYAFSDKYTDKASLGCNGCLKCVQKTFTVLFEFTYVRQVIYDTDELKMLLLNLPVMSLHHILDCYSHLMFCKLD
ncbi:hypothetical protein D8674_009759 [Pyrus ussuriensis x Pyrus communis]|uniref:DUF4216 domain-containing protein n=1 Tax=Pyrus ussuriensis x Pyrus communis TaxID=2448454 RepID=A0A5N5F8W4_9ROSA|nr:hypothetical protein D8674_009759 [Pyrus ussuriensis x Pyrus communis]